MKLTLIALILLFPIHVLYGQQLSFARSYAQLGTENLTRCVHDRNNNLIISGDRTINPGNGGSPYASNIWVRKYSATGTLLWTAQTNYTEGTSSFSVEMYGMAVDSLDNIFITGYFRPGTITMGGQSYTASTDNSGNLFYAKISPQGTVLWIKGVNESLHPNTSTLAHTLGITPEGHLILSGSFNKDIVIGNDTLIANITPASIYAPNSFYCKMDLDGVPIWTQKIEIPPTEIYQSKGWLNTLDADPQGNLFFVITKDSTLVFADTIINSPSNTMIVKCNPNGEVIKHFDLPGYPTSVTQLLVDRCGNVLIHGQFEDTLAIGHLMVESTTSRDTYIAKFDNDLNLTWLRIYSSSTYDRPGGIAVNEHNDIFIAFSFTGTITYGTPFTASGSGNALVIKLDKNGNHIWHKHSTGTGFAQGLSISVSSNNQVAIAGDYSGQNIFDSQTINTNASYPFDIFVVSYKDTTLATDPYNCLQEPLEVEQIVQNLDLLLYPNPANDWLTVELKELNQSYQVQIINSSGREISRGEYTENQYSFSVNELPEGLYLLKIVFANGSITTQRFVVQH